MKVVAAFRRKKRLMNDPTVMVLNGVLAAALGIFAISSLLVWASQRQGRGLDPADAPIDAAQIDGDSPFQPPVEAMRLPQMPPPLPVGKVPVWFYRPWDLFGAAFVFLIFGGLVIFALQNPGNPEENLDPMALLVNIGFQFLLAGIVTVLVGCRVRLVSWLGLWWPGWRWVFLIAPGSVFLMWMVFGGLQISGYVEWMESLGVETVQDTVQLLQKSDDPLLLGLMAFAAVIAAPLCEEVVFRGYFYPVMKKFAGMWPAAICSALVFSAAHGNLTAMLPLFLFGGLLVFIYEKTGSLWAPIAVHFCFNGATVAIQMAARYYNLPLDVPQ